MQIIEITDTDDPRIADYLHVRERDLIGRQGLFIAEGQVVIRALMKSPYATKSLLIADNRRGKLSAFETELAGIPVYVAAQAVMDRIAGFPIHRGMLALGERGGPRAARDLLAAAPSKAMVVAAVGIGNHDNIGAIFRNAAAFGVAAVLLDETSCDPLYRKALRVSVGAALTVPFARVTVAELPGLLAAGDFAPLALTPAGEQRLDSLRPSGRVALMLGSEGPGLPPALLAASQRVRIDMQPGFDSLNVATAGAIALHHLRAAAG